MLYAYWTHPLQCHIWARYASLAFFMTQQSTFTIQFEVDIDISMCSVV